MFDRIKKYYDKGLYNAEMVYKFVEKGILTEAEYEEIIRKG